MVASPFASRADRHRQTRHVRRQRQREAVALGARWFPRDERRAPTGDRRRRRGSGARAAGMTNVIEVVAVRTGRRQDLGRFRTGRVRARPHATCRRGECPRSVIASSSRATASSPKPFTASSVGVAGRRCGWTMTPRSRPVSTSRWPRVSTGSGASVGCARLDQHDRDAVGRGRPVSRLQRRPEPRHLFGAHRRGRDPDQLDLVGEARVRQRQQGRRQHAPADRRR